MTSAPAKRASTPRKTATRPPPVSNGQHPDGDGPGEQASVRPPEKVEVRGPDPQPTSGPAHPYGDREIFVWRPRGGAEPIVLPHINTVSPTQEFFCKIYDLNEMFQSFEWLILAGVPKEIRIRVAKLGDDDPAEQARLLRSWFAPITRPAGGEPPGEF